MTKAVDGRRTNVVRAESAILTSPQVIGENDDDVRFRRIHRECLESHRESKAGQ